MRTFPISIILTAIFLFAGCNKKANRVIINQQEHNITLNGTPDKEIEDDYYDLDEITHPLVKFISHQSGDKVELSTIITIASYNIYKFKVFSDHQEIKSVLYPLELWNYEVSFMETDHLASLEVVGYDSDNRIVAYDFLNLLPEIPFDARKGDLIGSLWITYYYLSREIEYQGKRDIILSDSQCVPMAVVSYDFANDICIEGSGKLMDQSVINFASICDCSLPCPLGGNICYTELEKSKYPWGAGARKSSLVPFRSLAVDRNVIPHGTIMYIEEWDGVYIPPVDGIGDFIHDGCFRADDVGGYIKNDHFDFFAGTRSMWLLLERMMPTRTRFTVYMDSPRCNWLKSVK